VSAWPLPLTADATAGGHSRGFMRRHALLNLASGLLCLLAWPGGASRATVPSGGRIPLIRIGLAPEVRDVHVSAQGDWFLGILGSHAHPTRIPASETWILWAENGRLVVTDATGQRRGATADTVFAYPDDLERGPLRFGDQPYRGEFLAWAVGDRVTLVNTVDLESYVAAVLPLELGPQPPAREAALRAQTVAARSYTLATMGRWADRGFDLLATVEDQVYGGIAAERPGCTAAVEETRGLVGVYEGAPIRAYYSSTCGGHTAAPEEVWHRPSAPYLQGVRDLAGRAEHSFCSDSPFFRWTEEWTGARFESLVRDGLDRTRAGWDSMKHGRLTGVSLKGRSGSSRAAPLRLSFQHGSIDLSGDEVRWILRRPGGEGLRSALLTSVQAARRRGRVVRVRISGQGYGHGVGMCQFGAMGMAEAGYTHEQIFRFYYRGAEIHRYY
jgi:stage II sporulation protein D